MKSDPIANTLQYRQKRMCFIGFATEISFGTPQTDLFVENKDPSNKHFYQYDILLC